MSSGDGQPAQFRTSRRNLAKGAAWAVPTIAVAAAAPARAASVNSRLEGWVVMSRETFFDGPPAFCGIRYDGYHDLDATFQGVRLGHWIPGVTIADITSPPSITIHQLFDGYNWTLETGSAAWTTPEDAGVDDLGWPIYRSEYEGPYTEGTGPDGRPEVVLSGRPHFRGVRRNSCPQTAVRQKITRSVGLNGELVEWTRETNFIGENGVPTVA